MKTTNRTNQIWSPVPEYLDQEQTSILTGMSEAWLERKRWEGGGIPFTKFGRSVRYRVSDILTWASARTRVNTSQGNLNYNASSRQRASQGDRS